MGKKSKKGVSRTTTKKHQHHAAGHGKSSSSSQSKAPCSGRSNGGNSQISSCDNSLDSNSVMFKNTLNPATGNGTTVAVTPMPIVHVKEQLLPPTQSQQRRLTEDELRTMIINNIARERSVNDKENKSASSGIPSMTVLSTKQPTKFTLNLDDGAIDNVVEVDMPPSEEQPLPTPVETVTNCEPTLSVEEPSTMIVENTTAVVDTTTTLPTEESTMLPALNNPEVPKELLDAETPVVPVQDEAVVLIDSIEPIQTLKEIVPMEESKQPIPTAIDSQQQHIWSSTLRSIVSTDENDDDDEVLADTSISNKAVMDVTPQKHPKMVVPIIQTVSPSPEHFTKQSNTISYLSHEEPVPSLDTPDKKDLDRNVKQNLCGCNIM